MIVLEQVPNNTGPRSDAAREWTMSSAPEIGFGYTPSYKSVWAERGTSFSKGVRMAQFGCTHSDAIHQGPQLTDSNNLPSHNSVTKRLNEIMPFKMSFKRLG